MDDLTKDIKAVLAGTSDKMADHLDEPEVAKTAGPNTPTKPRAQVGQPDTPGTASNKKTRTTIFVTSAKNDAGKTAAQRCELTNELVSAEAGIVDKMKSSPLRMKEQHLMLYKRVGVKCR